MSSLHPRTVPPSRTTRTGPALRIGELLLDPAQRRLVRDGEELRVGVRGFDLLQALARAWPDDLPADDLLRAAWGRDNVDRNNLRVQVAALRKLLGAEAIRHEATRGYRLMLPVRATDADTDACPEEAAVSRPGNLPEFTAVLHGRDADLEALDAALGEHARLSVVGPPGVGKTALATAAAQRQRDRHADGVFLVELAPLRSGALVCPAIAQVLGVKPGQAAMPLDLARALDRRDLLLVLDNAEHLRPAVQAVCDDLLRAAPGVRVLTTSRQPLKCAGEQVRAVEPLSLPEGDSLAALRGSGAVAMFEARARLADPRFAITPANAAAMARICRLVEGLPLALGFAAADVALWGVHGLAERLGAGLASLDLHREGSDSRHGTVQAAVRWSIELLGQAEQAVLRLLSVFAGNAPLPGVLTVAQALGFAELVVVKAIASLLDHFLLQADLASLTGRAAPDGPVRYHLHPMVRECARRLLDESGEAPAVLGAHARWAVTRAPDHLYDTPAPPQESQPDPEDLDNLRAALAWAVPNDRALALDLCSRMLLYWRATGLHAQAREVADPLADQPQPDDPPRLRLRLLVRLCSLTYEAQDDDRLLDLARRAQSLGDVRDPTMQLLALAWEGLVWGRRGDTSRSVPLFERTVEMARAIGQPAQTATQLGNLAWCLQMAGRFDEGRAALAEGLALNERGGTAFSVAMTHENIAELELGAGRPEVAQSHARSASLAYRRGGYVFRMLLCLVIEAEALRRSRLGHEAVACLHEVLELGEQRGFRALVGDALCCLAAVLAAQGDARRGLALLHAAERVRAQAGTAVGAVLKSAPGDCRCDAEQRLGAIERHAAMAEGEALGIAQALAWARAAAQAAERA